MKKILSLTFALLITSIFAIAAEPLEYDAAAVNQEFAQLNKVENFVNQNKGATFESIQQSNSELLQNVDISTTNLSIASNQLPLNIPPFWWGCVGCLLGVLAVYLISEKDNELTKKAMIGCVTSGALYLLYYIFAVATIAGKA